MSTQHSVLMVASDNTLETGMKSAEHIELCRAVINHIYYCSAHGPTVLGAVQTQSLPCITSKEDFLLTFS